MSTPKRKYNFPLILLTVISIQFLFGAFYIIHENTAAAHIVMVEENWLWLITSSILICVLAWKGVAEIDRKDKPKR